MKSHIIGFPTIGANRELKLAVESFWKGNSTVAELENRAAEIRAANRRTQKGMSFVCAGDFSFYDRMLDLTATLGLIPERFGFGDAAVSLEQYFTMARGDARRNIQAMEMTKWFDTNYHYIVPEIAESMQPQLRYNRIIDNAVEVFSGNEPCKVCIIGPITFLSLAKGVDEYDKWLKFDAIMDVYEKVLKFLAMSSNAIQIEEPILCADMEDAAKELFPKAAARIRNVCKDKTLILATYFGALDDNLELALKSGCDCLHIDAVRGAACVDTVVEKLPEGMSLSLGVVDGRNIWKNDLARSREILGAAVEKLGGERVWVASSCSLAHVPVDLAGETKLPERIKNWLSFAVQKCGEISTLCDSLNGADILSRKNDPAVHNPDVQKRLANLDAQMYSRKSPYAARKLAQKNLGIPLLPTTTIGSFPQTPEIRKARRQHKRGEMDDSAYESFMKVQIADAVRIQEEIGLDVLVHGEPERNDMVEYFGEMLDGFCFTENGWVLSYGSRCVKPPVIFGDVSRRYPMTVKWIDYARSLTKKPMKGMLTGPVTILCWSFVRNDIERSEVCRQIALAIRDEVADLEKSGIGIIQIDEAALREGMPIKRRDKNAYLKWAVECFRLATACVEDSTQIHTHMCYSEFNKIIEAIAAMDADVVSIESSRSKMELLDVFANFEYPNEIGPGVYDIHSPRIPEKDEIVELIKKALKYIPAQRLWINPDCGLKTRRWEEVIPSLKNMVAAAKEVRSSL